MGMRVLELGNFIAGPFCSVLLADQGADVLKIEQPGVGDMTRRLPPFIDGESSGFQLMNRNKRSLALNLKHDAGREVFLQLADGADVILENFRPGTMEDLGIGYETIRARNPGIIYCSVSGFGQDGPYSRRAAVDLILQGMSGILSATGEPGQPPARPSVQIGDISGALFAVYGILCAYVERQRTGQGQHLDVSLLECAIAVAVWETSSYLATGVSPAPLGRRHRTTAPYQAFQTADGFITIGAPNDVLWRRLCAVLGLDDLAADPAYGSVAKRKARDIELVSVVEKVTKTRSSCFWLERLEREGIPCGPIYRYDEVFRDPQVASRKVLVEYEHPTLGAVQTIRNPVHAGANGAVSYAPAPLLGQHTVPVLESIGYSEKQIQQLMAAGTIEARAVDVPD
jgi:crotonobetainyl-CoA:carnitine CoA-transferase CaiB-like acyl-CoA transferase